MSNRGACFNMSKDFTLKQHKDHRNVKLQSQPYLDTNIIMRVILTARATTNSNIQPILTIWVQQNLSTK